MEPRRKPRRHMIKCGNCYYTTKVMPKPSNAILEHLQWVPASRGYIPPKAVQAGVTVKGEKLYIGCPRSAVYGKIIPGIIQPSLKVIEHYNYPRFVTSVYYKVLTSKVPDILYWKAVEDLTRQEFLHNAVTIMDPQSECHPHVTFIAKVDNPATATTSDKSEVVGPYKYFTQIKGPLIGSGEAQVFVDRDDIWPIASPRDSYLNALRVTIPYNGKIFKIGTQFSVLCCYSIPKLHHYTLPELKWETISNGPLPSNAFPAGVAPNGEVLYVGRKQHKSKHLAVGYVVPSEKRLQLSWERDEYWYESEYEVLVVEEDDELEWGLYSHASVPPNAAVGGYYNDEQLFIGRTALGSDISLGKRRYSDNEINLPEDRVTNTQLVGKIQCSYGGLCLPWDEEEYIWVV